MTHQDKGHFAAKHKNVPAIQPELANLIHETALDGRLSCGDAFAIASQLILPPARVGVALDVLEISITQCQLGLFGYSPERKIIKPLSDPPGPLVQAIRESQTQTAISCADLWQVAARQGISKLEAAGACETLGIKIRPCQLGAF